MNRRQTVVCAVLAVMALLALYGTWSQNLAYFASNVGPAAFGAFVQDARVNPAARSLGVDIVVTYFAASVFMVSEARKLRVRFVWAYVILGMLVAISVTFPLFLIAREARLARISAGEACDPAEPGMGDLAGLTALAVFAVALSVFVISPR